MLELVRNGILNVVQENNFEDIIISKQELGASD
jgi:chromatin segregation and condensation protein Rec8/ScpA/Scc1 (kleisin family)